MKKILLVLSFLPSLAGAANVTQAQVQQVQVLSSQIAQQALAIQTYANFVNNAFNQNFQFTVPYSTNPVVIGGATQTDVVDVQRYLAMKAQLQSLVNQLP